MKQPICLPSDEQGLLVLADWLEEFGTCYEIVKAAAIRGGRFTLAFTKDEWGTYWTEVETVGRWEGWGKACGRGCAIFPSDGFGYTGFEGFTLGQLDNDHNQGDTLNPTREYIVEMGDNDFRTFTFENYSYSLDQGFGRGKARGSGAGDGSHDDY